MIRVWVVFLSGAIAISALILPGISGSFILIILGAYKTLSDALHDFDIKKILIFTSGAAIGLLSFSHLLKWLFKNFHNTTLALLTGFIFGSLNKVWPWKKTIFKTDTEGVFLLDSTGEKIIQNYKRYIPELDTETYYAIAFIFIGIGVLIGL